ncbi:MAG: hypothetical protein WAN81_06050 [Candidatus Binataceae bacterium]
MPKLILPEVSWWSECGCRVLIKMVAVVALANKNARVMWALLARGDCYRVLPALDRAAAA